MAVMLVERTLNTREMAQAMGSVDLAWVSKLCKDGKIPGAWRIGPNGNWRIHSEGFRKFLVENGIPTHNLDRILQMANRA